MELSLGSFRVLNNDSDALPATDASGRTTRFQIIALHFIYQVDDHTNAGRGERMPQCNRTAIHIDDLPIEFQFFFHAEVLRGKGLIDFPKVNVPLFDPRAGQCLLDRRYRATSHDSWIHAADASGRHR